MDKQMIPLESIRIDGGTQIRVEINTDVVNEYAEQLSKMPPVSVYFDGTDYWLADGFHRYHAARKAGVSSIEADVRKGTVDDARWFAVGANQQHGLRRTNADKEKAVVEALKLRPNHSDRAIAEYVGVTQPFVSKVRAKQGDNGYHPSIRIGRDGKTYPGGLTYSPCPPETTTAEPSATVLAEDDESVKDEPLPGKAFPAKSHSSLDRYPTIKALLKRLYDLSCYRDEQLSALAVREIAKQLTLELTKVL